MRFDLVVFDLDGTLVDSVPDIASALARALATSAFPPVSEASVQDWVGEGARRLVERAVPAGVRSRQVDTVLAAFVAEYGARVCEGTTVYPGIREALASLAGRVPLCVLSNKPDHLTRALLQQLGLAGSFSQILGEGGRFPRKPAPDALLYLAAAHGATVDRSIIVGDGIPDIQTARASGAQVAAVTWGYTPGQRLAAESPDFVLDRPEQLAPLLGA